ncbi:MAG: multidrug transporter AcrB [Acidobacteria bacterium RIFCSPLOWO2_02_FULL_67_36]|nr:MAG: multidrug transporter AcrB [Acidobacteria bacterium RIFCSPLOWO2_02_FULL_67_36]OFW21955.1 MAG: multidrug transporter AcrB [Acidobacteria bacterium RIFCSPLOWO2_12_FULL_66_21]
MKRLIQWSIDHHWMVIAMSALLLAAGLWVARDMPVDVFPDLTAPTVTILTEGHGMAPDEMESLVTFPIESAINGASGVRRVRSATALGIAVVWVEFDWGTDIYVARQLVAEKLSLVSGTLPPQVERPILTPISSIMGEILFFALSSDTEDPLTLRTLADTVVRRRLLAVAGVSQVTPIGGAERQFQVIARPELLRANDVSLTELLDAVRGASQNTSAGIYTEGPQEYVLQAIGRARTPKEIGEGVIALRGARPVLIRDVAAVREGAALKRGEGARNGKPAVIIGVQKQPGANTIDVTARLDRELDALQRELPRGITIDRKIFRQSDFIEVAVDNVVKALRDGGLLVILIVVVFLANLRAAAITITAMPLSLAAAVLVLRGFGATINTMTLGGMAIAIGALVDDAIIDVENVVRRLRENHAKPVDARRPIGEVVRDATLEINSSIVFATIIIILVFLPIFGLAGIEGRLLTPLAFAYIVSLAASLLVAIVVTPALCLAFLPTARSIEQGHEGWLARTLKARFARDLPRVLDHPTAVIIVSGLLLAGAIAAMTQMGSAFLPEFHEGNLTIQANTLPGTSLAKSDEIGRRVEQILLSQPEVVATARRTGRAEADEHVQGVEAAEIDVGLRETARPRAEFLADLRREFSTLPGTNATIGQPISHRIDHMLSGTRANIAVKIFGDDLLTLRRLGERVRETISGVPGVADLSLEQQMDIPFVRFVLNRAAIARYGLHADDVAEAVETSFAGTTVGRIFDRGTSFDLVVKFDPAGHAEFERIADLPVDTPTGGSVPIRLLADVRREEGPNMVLRENVQRRIVISCNVAGRDLGGVITDIRAAIAQSVPMPAGYRVEYGGQFESQQSASRRLLLLGVAVLAGLFILLVLAFGRPRDAVLIMLNLPLALIGGVVGVFLAGGVLSVASMIGFISLFGIATRNGIMLVSHIQHLMEEEDVTDFREAVQRGARERLIPILMTAMAAGLALIPLAVSGGRAGSEIQTPMAIVILCGLMSSTLLNMIVVPTLYLRYGRPAGGRAL